MQSRLRPMIRLSSRLTWAYKWIVPLLWLAAGVMFVRTIEQAPAPERELALAVLAGIATAALLGFKLLVWSAADEVWDEGTALRIRRGGVETRIALADIVRLRHTLADVILQLPRWTLTLRQPGPLGSRIAFFPAISLIPWSRHPELRQLLARIAGQRAR